MLDLLKQKVRMTETENGAATYETSGSECLDLFASIGAFRHAGDEEIINCFIRAYTENADLAMKILFYARDIRGGLGERHVFRTILLWLAKNETESVKKNLTYISEYGRFDDLLTLLDTPCEKEMLDLLKLQFTEDLHCASAGEHVSLLAKWLRIAGFDKIPAIVKKDLTEEEAYVYVIEINVIQRSFSELLPSEKGEVLTERYEKVVCQGKRNDILLEIARLEGKKISCGHDVHKKTRDSIGEEYGMVGRNAARYLRVHFLNDDLKLMLDTGKLTLVASVEISFLNEEEQAMVYRVLKTDGIKADLDNARELRNQTGNLTMDLILDILTRGKSKKNSVSAKRVVYIREKYFKDTEPEEMWETIEEALKQYFEKG